MGKLIGKSLQAGKYNLEQEIGRGGFGITFRAIHNRLDQVVVIKTLNESWWDAPNLSELQHQFQDEARRLALCVHPNVVRVTDFFTEDRLPYMVMDYIPGRPLSEIVFPNHPLPEALATTYIAQIGEALKAVHQKGLLHRDVKPHNIMVDERTGEAVLIDFGIAREFTRDQTQTQTSFLSAGYAPIEQYLSRAKRTPATDVYGLAATMYSLLTGQAPIASILRHRQSLRSPRDLQPEVSPIVNQAVMRGMALEIDDRPATVDAWLSLLPKAKLLGSQSQSFRPQTSWGKTAATVAVAPVYYPQADQPTGNTAVNQTANQTKAIDKPPTKTVVAQTPSKGWGCSGFFWTLTALSMITLGALGIGAFGLYQQFAQRLSEVMEWATAEDEPEPNLSNEPDSTSDFSRIKFPPLTLETTSSESAPTSSSSDPDDTQSELATDAPTDYLSASPSLANRPLLLANAGDPANAHLQVGVVANQSTPVIRGFSPGTPESMIRQFLGEPDQIGEGYWPNTRAAIYELTPNRATLAYFYDQDTGQVRQSEAAFAQSIDQGSMKWALVNMLDGRSTVAIETALEQVRSRQLNYFPISQGQFQGVIERNQHDQIYIQIWDVDFRSTLGQ